jgi:carboxypeptidase Taq
MTIQKIKDHLQEFSYLKSIEALLQWDMETTMPPGAIEDRAKRLSYIQGKLHTHITSKRYSKMLQEMKSMKLKALEKKLLKELLWDLEVYEALPKKHVEELSHLQAVASHAWAQAREKNDWSSFLPQLEKLIALKKRETTYFKVKRPYDALLRRHDKEFTSADIDRLFGALRPGLLKLKDQVEKDGRFVKVKDLKAPFDIEAQKRLSLKVAALFGLSPKISRLDVSAHPFSINISPQDQRITTRYTDQDLDSLSSTMHEVGHALYEAGLPLEWEGTPFQEAISLSVHESQSRFWENVIGRSRAFCEFIHPEVQKEFPYAMKGITPEGLFTVMNKSVPGPIRVESSELYYNFHVMVRYETEEMIFNQGLLAKDLPQVWAKKYEHYLGITPKSHAEGVLQDSHWAGGAFGYFPTYSLGNLISGSLHKKMKQELPEFEKLIGSGEFTRIREWLGDNIHSKGRSITSKDIVGELDVTDYLGYLKEKFDGK